MVFVSASAHRPDVNVRAHPAKPFGLIEPDGKPSGEVAVTNTVGITLRRTYSARRPDSR